MGKAAIEKDEISRVRRSKAAARASYDRMSGWYDWMAGSSEKGFTEQGLELLCVQPGEHVLEIGCGTGQSLLALSHAAGAIGRVYGLDLSSGMLHQSAKRLRRANCGIRDPIDCRDASSPTFARKQPGCHFYELHAGVVPIPRKFQRCWMNAGAPCVRLDAWGWYHCKKPRCPLA